MNLYDRILDAIRYSSFEDYKYSNLMVLYNGMCKKNHLQKSPAGFSLDFEHYRSSSFYYRLHLYHVIMNWIDN